MNCNVADEGAASDGTMRRLLLMISSCVCVATITLAIVDNIRVARDPYYGVCTFSGTQTLEDTCGLRLGVGGISFAWLTLCSDPSQEVQGTRALGFRVHRSLHYEDAAQLWQSRWEIRVPLWAPIIVFGAFPSYSVVEVMRRRKRAKRGFCEHCGYSLTGFTEPRCPECGHGFTNHEQKDH